MGRLCDARPGAAMPGNGPVPDAHDRVQTASPGPAPLQVRSGG